MDLHVAGQARAPSTRTRPATGRLRDRGGDRARRHLERPGAAGVEGEHGAHRVRTVTALVASRRDGAPRRKGRAGHRRRVRDRPRDRAGARRRGRGRRRRRPRRGGRARRRGGDRRPRVRLRRRRPRGGPRDGRVRRRARAAGSTSSTSTRASRPAAASATTSTSPATGARWGRTSTGWCSASTPPCRCCGTAAAIVATASLAGLTGVPYDPLYAAEQARGRGPGALAGARPRRGGDPDQRGLPRLRGDRDHRRTSATRCWPAGST